MYFEKWGHKDVQTEWTNEKNPWKPFLLRQFYTLYEQNFSSLRPLLLINFPQEFRKSKMFGHWTLGSGGKNTVKQSEKDLYQQNPAQKIKICLKTNFFCKAILHHLLVKKIANLRPLLSITFPQGFRISKFFGYLTSGSGGKKTFKRYLKSDTDISINRKHRPRGPMLWKFRKVGFWLRSECKDLLSYFFILWLASTYRHKVSP